MRDNVKKIVEEEARKLYRSKGPFTVEDLGQAVKQPGVVPQSKASKPPTDKQVANHLSSMINKSGLKWKNGDGTMMFYFPESEEPQPTIIPTQEKVSMEKTSLAPEAKDRTAEAGPSQAAPSGQTSPTGTKTGAPELAPPAASPPVATVEAAEPTTVQAEAAVKPPVAEPLPSPPADAGKEEAAPQQSGAEVPKNGAGTTKVVLDHLQERRRQKIISWSKVLIHFGYYKIASQRYQCNFQFKDLELSHEALQNPKKFYERFETFADAMTGLGLMSSFKAAKELAFLLHNIESSKAAEVLSTEAEPVTAQEVEEVRGYSTVEFMEKKNRPFVKEWVQKLRPHLPSEPESPEVQPRPIRLMPGAKPKPAKPAAGIGAPQVTKSPANTFVPPQGENTGATTGEEHLINIVTDLIIELQERPEVRGKLENDVWVGGLWSGGRNTQEVKSLAPAELQELHAKLVNLRGSQVVTGPTADIVFVRPPVAEQRPKSQPQGEAQGRQSAPAANLDEKLERLFGGLQSSLGQALTSAIAQVKTTSTATDQAAQKVFESLLKAVEDLHEKNKGPETPSTPAVNQPAVQPKWGTRAWGALRHKLASARQSWKTIGVAVLLVGTLIFAGNHFIGGSDNEEETEEETETVVNEPLPMPSAFDDEITF